MLRHKSITLICGIVFAALLYIQASWYWFLLLILVYSLIEFYGAYFIQSNFHLNAICASSNEKREIALSFDDGPHPTNTIKVLDVLKKHQVKATFFCIGKNVKENPSVLKQIDAEGHIIGNHSYSHANMYDLNTKGKFVNDINSCQNKIEQVIGKRPIFFRPPYGVTTPALGRAVRTLNLDVIGWNIRSYDTSIKDRERMKQRVTSRLKPGAIILFHDVMDDADKYTEDIIEYAKEHQYEIVPLDKLINRKAYA